MREASADAPQADPPHHDIAVAGRVGTLHLDLHFSLRAPWTVLFGPSGCGKSSVLRAMCGLTHGMDVVLARHSRDAPNTVLASSTVCVPPERRGFSYAAQQAALFPHLSVRRNVGFPAAVRSRNATNAALAQDALALFELTPLAARLPRLLSGGERQRVSLARAFAVPDARLLLLDEPFAGVDRALRDDLLPRMQAWCRERDLPVLSVTHDVDEVFALRAEVVRLKEGQIVSQGSPGIVLAEEAARVRRLLGPAFDTL